MTRPRILSGIAALVAIPVLAACTGGGGVAATPAPPATAAPSVDAPAPSEAPAIDGLPAGDWQVALTAVVETADGEVSYWSLAHPAGKPDFHHADCFCLEIPGNPDP